MKRIILIAFCLMCFIGTASAYGVYLSCPESVQADLPLKCSIDSDFPPGTTFDIVFYQTQYTATEISRQPITIQEDNLTQYKILDTKGLPGGNYKVEVQYTSKGEASLRSDSVTMQLVKIIGSPNETVVPTTISTITIATPTPAYGSISVSSTPSGANIYLDNALKGLTTLTMDNIANGNHIVLVRLTGYQDWTQNVTVLNNATSLTVNLAAMANTTTTTTTITPTPTPALNSTANGSIYVQSNPSGSRVLLNNVPQGITPMTLYNLTGGTSPLVTVRSSGYNEWSQNVAVTAGGTTSVIASLVLAPEETTVTVTTPKTTVTTVITTVKSTTKFPTLWPTNTPTQPSPLGIEIGIIATIGVALIVMKRK